jgi:hypothetical protein
MINIQVHFNPSLANNILDNKFIKNISKKIHVEENSTIVNKYLIILDEHKESANTCQLCFKKIINMIPGSTVDKLLFIENMFKGEDCFIVAPGPSYQELTEEQKNNIFNNYFTIAVKYIINEFIKSNLYPFIYAYSDNNEKVYDNIFNNVCIYSILCKFIKIKNKATNKLIKLNKSLQFDDKYDILFVNNVFNINNSIKKNSHWTFNEFVNGNDPTNIYNNILSDKDKNELGFYYYPTGHIMYEIAIPICVHLGFSNIYTIGWDCNYTKQSYYYAPKRNVKILDRVKCNSCVIENTYFMHKVMKEKYNINIYKTSNDSLVKLPIIDINEIFNKP